MSMHRRVHRDNKGRQEVKVLRVLRVRLGQRDSRALREPLDLWEIQDMRQIQVQRERLDSRGALDRRATRVQQARFPGLPVLTGKQQIQVQRV